MLQDLDEDSAAAPVLAATIAAKITTDTVGHGKVPATTLHGPDLLNYNQAFLLKYYEQVMLPRFKYLKRSKDRRSTKGTHLHPLQPPPDLRVELVPLKEAKDKGM